LLIYKGEYRVALSSTLSVYKQLEEVIYSNKYSWIKYQYTLSLLKFHEEGFLIDGLPEYKLLEMRDILKDEGNLDDLLRS
jgi:hypothetical protein